jgi:hypothetical protein
MRMQAMGEGYSYHPWGVYSVQYSVHDSSSAHRREDTWNGYRRKIHCVSVGYSYSIILGESNKQSVLGTEKKRIQGRLLEKEDTGCGRGEPMQ